MKEFQIEGGEDSQQIFNVLEEKIYEFNSNKIIKYDGALFTRIIRNEQGILVAGIAGWTWAGACEIALLWVGQELRNIGLGKKLLRAAEEEAKRKKCNIILVRSYSFQAPFFYEKHGYKIEHMIENFPTGYRYYILMKTI